MNEEKTMNGVDMAFYKQNYNVEKPSDLIAILSTVANNYAIEQVDIPKDESQELKQLLIACRLGKSQRKLVELVVEECCDYINKEAERLYALNHDDGDLLAEKCHDIMEGLKEHFGVEE